MGSPGVSGVFVGPVGLGSCSACRSGCLVSHCAL